MSLPAGAPSPAPTSFDDVWTVHAVDGDGTALCGLSVPVEQINSFDWSETPAEQRCPTCALIMAAASR